MSAAQGELEVLGGHEIPIQRVIAIEAHPAVYVLGGCNDARTGFGGEELGHGELSIGWETLV